MDYPNLPPDVLRIIATQSPQVYGQLARASSSMNRAVQPVLRSHCERPITAIEIARYLHKSELDLKNYFLTHPNRVPIQISKYLDKFWINWALKDWETFISLLDRYLQQGYEPSPIFIFLLLQKRLSCQLDHPTYAHRRAIVAERKRILSSRDHSETILHPLRRLMVFLGPSFVNDYTLFVQNNIGPLPERIERAIHYLDNLLTRL